MEVNVYSTDGDPIEQVELPPIFEEEFRPDIIRRAVLAAQTSRVQSWGSDPQAGKRTTAETPGKRTGLTRVRRVKGRGYHAAGRGAFAPFTKGGRRTHPPRPEQRREERINKKERHLAIRSAISATKERDLVTSRGHEADRVKEFPIVVDEKFEGINRTKEVKEALKNLAVGFDVERSKNKRKIRSGKGKMRGRRYRQAVGPLIVIGRDDGVVQAARNLPGVDVVPVEGLNAELLAPGGEPARLTVWTRSAVERLGGMFR